MELSWDRQLGRGAAGIVWLATDRIGRSVAVKFFSDTTPSQIEQSALAHARALARVSHPAVVNVLSVEEQINPDTNTTSLAVIMEYVHGPSLSMYRDSFDATLATRIAQDISGGLSAIHSAGLVHGDLHEGNVMLTGTGAKLIDILYTHSLADVGARTAQATQLEDLRSLARILRQVFSAAGCNRNA